MLNRTSKIGLLYNTYSISTQDDLITFYHFLKYNVYISTYNIIWVSSISKSCNIHHQIVERIAVTYQLFPFTIKRDLLSRWVPFFKGNLCVLITLLFNYWIKIAFDLFPYNFYLGPWSVSISFLSLNSNIATIWIWYD